jgi:ribonuclease HI
VKHRWTKPSVGWIKLNWNAAIDSNSNNMGLGIVARDSTGKVRAMMCNFLPYLTDSAVAETYAAQQGTLLARDMGFQNVILEGDSQVIVYALNSGSVSAIAYASLVDDTQTILNTFPAWRVVFVQRVANAVVHHLAHVAVSNLFRTLSVILYVWIWRSLMKFGLVSINIASELKRSIQKYI